MKASLKKNLMKQSLTKKVNKTIKSRLLNIPSFTRRPNPTKVMKKATLRILISKNLEFMEVKVPSFILMVRNMSVNFRTVNVMVMEKNLDLMVKKYKMKFGKMASVFTTEESKEAQ